MKLRLERTLAGRILDIGGGGECVMGRLYGARVTAIDRSREELDEAPNVCEKRLMDAEELEFGDCSFESATFFYTLMYMPRDTQARAIAEAARVLKPGGRLAIWDCEIERAFPEPHLAELELDIAGKRLNVTYGIIDPNARQCADTFVQLCGALSLIELAREQRGSHFALEFVKPGEQ
ncbi:MAG: methyltransferase domain-containing protein [Candidatus Faecivicinus sp.]|nr:methyltransferase domain-containing protein [Candidatus Faecivicinus sp.]